MTGQTLPPDRDLLARLIETELVASQPAGSRLPPERQLALQFRVSRPVVREALRGLAERGVIDVVPGRGTFTRRIGTAEAVRPIGSLLRQTATPRMLVEARLMLECQSAELAAQRATPPELNAMSAALAAFDRANSPVDKARYDIAFHMLVAQATHNPVIETMFHAIAESAFELMVRSLADATVQREGAVYHSEILTAIRRGDSTAARAGMHAHVALALDRYGSDLDERVDVLAEREIRRLMGPGATLEEILSTVQLLDQPEEPPAAKTAARKARA
jgi:GntR family transcriptional repressor for pyruvate dehydrogenase complex